MIIENTIFKDENNGADVTSRCSTRYECKMMSKMIKKKCKNATSLFLKCNRYDDFVKMQLW